VVTQQTGAETKYAARAVPDPTFYVSLFDTMAEGVVCQSASGEILAINPAAERIQGRSGRELSGVSLDAHWQAIHEDGTPFPASAYPSTLALRTGQPTSSVIMGLLRPDNMRIWISIAAQPIFEPGTSRPLAVVCTFHDVTARVRAAQEVRRLNVMLERRVDERTRQLAAALADLESFSYSVSHDLRAPLRAIDNFSSILQEEYASGLDAEGRRLIGIVRKNRFLEPGVYSCEGDRHTDPPRGIFGGYDGLPGKSTFIDKDGNERDIPAKVTGFLCGAGEVIQLTEPNSGGYGNPLDREPRMVLEDVLDDFTTIELAREAYGVVISEGLVVDEKATEELRAKLRSERGADFQGELLKLVSTPHPMAISPYAKAT